MSIWTEGRGGNVGDGCFLTKLTYQYRRVGRAGFTVLGLSGVLIASAMLVCILRYLG